MLLWVVSVVSDYTRREARGAVKEKPPRIAAAAS